MWSKELSCVELLDFHSKSRENASGKSVPAIDQHDTRDTSINRINPRVTFQVNGVRSDFEINGYFGSESVAAVAQTVDFMRIT